HNATDLQLLRAYAQQRDERAFAAIVERYFAVVYAAARRHVRGNSHLAEDVTQAVFIMLARKAASLREGASVAGWLITAARLAAKTALRGEIRRKRREKRYGDMNPRHDQITDTDPTSGAPLPQISGPLDEALDRLSDADRAAVTLRYLHDRPIVEV